MGEFDRRQEKWRAEMRQRDEIVWEARLADGAIDLRPKPISKRIKKEKECRVFDEPKTTLSNFGCTFYLTNRE